MSEREEIANKIVEFVKDNRLDTVYSNNGLSKDKKYRFILLSKPRVLDGEVKIYGPKFIQIKWMGLGRGTNSDVFNSVESALEFMKLAFIECDFEKADMILRRS